MQAMRGAFASRQRAGQSAEPPPLGAHGACPDCRDGETTVPRFEIERDMYGAEALPTGATRSALGFATCAAGVMLMFTAPAQTPGPRPVAMAPSEMSWVSQGPLAAPGMEQLNLVGDPAKPGPYTLRLK